MALFAISYDLVKKKDYQALWDALEHMGAHKALNSFYLANVNTTDPEDVVAMLKPYIDSDDRLIVVRFGGQPKYTKAFVGTNDWVIQNPQ